MTEDEFIMTPSDVVQEASLPQKFMRDYPATVNGGTQRDQTGNDEGQPGRGTASGGRDAEWGEPRQIPDEFSVVGGGSNTVAEEVSQKFYRDRIAGYSSKRCATERHNREQQNRWYAIRDEFIMSRCGVRGSLLGRACFFTSAERNGSPSG